MASGTIKKMGEIKSYSGTTSAVNISSGSNNTFSVTIPSGGTDLLAVIPLAIKVGSTYGTATPAVITDATISGNTATINVRSFATQTYQVQYTLLYR